jgi:hypothetical protein
MTYGAFLFYYWKISKYPKIYFTPQCVLDYINKWKTVIGNPPFDEKVTPGQTTFKWKEKK